MAKPTSSTPETTPADADIPVADLSFEVALSELERLVRTMEEEQLPLETAIAAYRRGSELLGHCQQLLKEAEHKVQALENGILRDLDAPHGETR
ncbi:exodeoxyribonuclease VII small subunit [Propionivibrio dicarboxylicus]|uniref:Exodeoxyribonuclease 7 small subunit n=1 Tax=Propionivibrio dicarboxylicus TaxID=83767 RepID=A0A1G7ZQ47_9RHOO|nr:exodeoxyribonuclease VII small subunit [Propionivibrio dicarboxylicus]SDH10872.1 Exodeoxyribonuclease VII small subunit [Propionivibrio dicarboxylicus]